MAAAPPPTMNTSPNTHACRPRSRVTRWFAAALDGDEHALRELHLLAFELTAATPAETREADRALHALDRPQPAGSAPPGPIGQGCGVWAVGYVDQLEARYRSEASSLPGRR